MHTAGFAESQFPARRPAARRVHPVLIGVTSRPVQGLTMMRTHPTAGPGCELPPSREKPSRGPHRRALLSVAAALGVALAVAGCAGTAPTPASSASGSPGSAVAASPASNAPNPNAPEIVAAGDIPDNQVFVPVTPAGAPYTVSVPQGWVQSNAGAATVFTDKFNSIRMEARPMAAVPDVASVQAQDVPAVQASSPGFTLGSVQAVQRKAGPAVLMTYSATSATNAVTGKSVTEAVERYVFWRGGQEAILTLSGPKGSDNVDPWRMVTDSFRWAP
jgi:hypothetical protein